MKKFFSILLMVNSAILVQAQTAKDSVINTVTNFFEGMKKADTVLLKSALTNSTILQTVKNDKGSISVNEEPMAEFINFVSTQTPGDADEQIEIGSVNIDGPLATVWTPYKFYYKKKFRHCGVNSFQLVNFGNGWKIQYIIDTRKRLGCE